MNGKKINVTAGDAILTRPGNSHGLKLVGNDSLTLIINYNKQLKKFLATCDAGIELKAILFF